MSEAVKVDPKAIGVWQLHYARNVEYNPDSAIDEEGVAKDMAIRGFMAELEQYAECRTERNPKLRTTQVVCSICMPYVRNEVIVNQEWVISNMNHRIDLLVVDNDNLQEQLSKPWWKKLWK